MESTLRNKKGVREAKASYPESKLDITFDDSVINEKDIEQAVRDAGFRVVRDSD